MAAAARAGGRGHGGGRRRAPGRSRAWFALVAVGFAGVAVAGYQGVVLGTRAWAPTGQTSIRGATADALARAGASRQNPADRKMPAGEGIVGADGSRPAPGTRCAGPVTVTIRPKGTRYAFSPDHAVVDEGQSILFADRTSVGQTLLATPEAGIGKARVLVGQTRPVRFNLPGKYLMRTDRSGPAAFRLTVRSRMGTTCGITAPSAVLSIQAGGFSPSFVFISAGSGIAITNDSGTAQTLSCSPDPKVPRAELALKAGQTRTAVFRTRGAFSCRAVRSSTGARVVVIVQRTTAPITD